MTPSKPGRGRPKGSGLNDAAQLRAIAGLIAADPDLKPTTAIKTLGISDPSVIRRLRDKYSAVGRQLMAEIAPELPFGEAVAATVKMTARTDSAIPPCARAMPPAGPTAARQHGSVATADAQAAPLTATGPVAERPAGQRAIRPSHIPLPSQTDLPHWMGVGLSFYALSCQAQFAVMGTMFQWPPVAAVLASQVAFTELAIAMSSDIVKSNRVG